MCSLAWGVYTEYILVEVFSCEHNYMFTFFCIGDFFFLFYDLETTIYLYIAGALLQGMQACSRTQTNYMLTLYLLSRPHKISCSLDCSHLPASAFFFSVLLICTRDVLYLCRRTVVGLSYLPVRYM